MGLRINTNLASMAANRALSKNSTEQTAHFERLASGNRITKAGDDAAGLSISENLRAQTRSMAQAERNAQDSVSYIQVAEGGLTEISNMMIRLRELAVQAASDTIGDRERGFINKEVSSLVSEVDRISNSTSFGGVNLLNGQASKGELEFQVGITNSESDRIKFNVNETDVRSSSLGVDGLDYSTIDKARDSLDKVDAAMAKVFESRAGLGATQNKLQSTINSIQIGKENLAQARSRIADTDVAAETSELVKGNILSQAGVAVLAQANQAPTQALRLL